jgi:CRISPR/Cas system-associated exonuclease Cas4 (RecB family)
MTKLEQLKQELEELKLRLQALENSLHHDKEPPLNNQYKCPVCQLERSHTYICFREDCAHRVTAFL